MEKSAKSLVLEARTILYVLEGLATNKKESLEDSLQRDELCHFLRLAKVRLDSLNQLIA